MANTLKDIMTPNPTTVAADTPLVEAARLMRDNDIGDVIVLEGDTVCGIVTDRDIVVRALAEGRDVQSTTVAEVCTRDLVTMSPEDDVHRAAEVMRERAIRRLPVVEGGRPVGVVSIGDLAIERDPDSALADISAAEGNN